MQPVPRVIDLSHHNTIPSDLSATRRAGIIGCIHKLTEGSGYTDDKVTARYYLARQAAMAWGVYHFLRPGDPNEQAAHFLDEGLRLGVIDEQTVLVADHEDQGVPGEDLKRFLDAVEDAMQRSPVIYSGHVLKEQLEGTGYKPKRRLWLCQYAAEPVLPEGVDRYWLWQYTDSGDIPGVNPPVDLNHFEGDMVEFLSGWSGAYEPNPAPPVTVPTLTISADAPVRLHLGPNVEVV